ENKVTPTDRLSGFEGGLATISDSVERVPRGHWNITPVLTVVPAHHFPVAWLPNSGYLFGLAHRQIEVYGGESGRSPARRTFELKLAEAPSGPLISRRAMGQAPCRFCSYPLRFLGNRFVPARLRSRATRVTDACLGALITSLRGRPGPRRMRLKASRSLGRIAHTTPTLIPYRRCLSSSRRT